MFAQEAGRKLSAVFVGLLLSAVIIVCLRAILLLVINFVKSSCPDAATSSAVSLTLELSLLYDWIYDRFVRNGFHWQIVTSLNLLEWMERERLQRRNPFRLNAEYADNLAAAGMMGVLLVLFPALAQYLPI
jgi:hypothetical protein